MGIVAPGELGIGLQLPVQSQSRIYVEPWEATAGPDELLAVARAADEAGFLYVGVCDHLGIPDSHVSRMGATWYDPLTTLAFVAAATRQVRLLTHVYVLGLRHPLAAAKQLATLDRLSGGRLIVGVGAGHVEAEFDALGVPFGDRGAVLDEALDALRLLLDEPVASFHGDRFHVSGLHLEPRPVQPHVPLWVGGSGRPALRRVARIGDGWLPQGTPLDDMPAQIAVIHDHLDGRTVDDLGGMAPPMFVGDPGWDVGRWTLTGSGDELAAHLARFRAVGCTHVQVRLRSRSCDELLDQIDRFGTDVMPALAGVSSR